MPMTFQGAKDGPHKAMDLTLTLILKRISQGPTGSIISTLGAGHYKVNTQLQAQGGKDWYDIIAQVSNQLSHDGTMRRLPAM